MSLATLCLSLELPVALRVVSATRRYVVEGLSSIGADEGDSSRIAIALHELFENAVKYGQSGTVELSLRVERDSAGVGLVAIRTTNRASASDCDEVIRILGEIAGAADGMALYDTFIRRSVGRQGSGLGLARIRAESDMTLGYELSGDRVTVVADGCCALRKVG